MEADCYSNAQIRAVLAEAAQAISCPSTAKAWAMDFVDEPTQALAMLVLEARAATNCVALRDAADRVRREATVITGAASEAACWAVPVESMNAMCLALVSPETTTDTERLVGKLVLTMSQRDRMRNAIRLILPLAKGYTALHRPTASTREWLQVAEDALDEKEPGNYTCAARSNPADCDWPICGCDPHANKALEALAKRGDDAARDARPCAKPARTP